MNNFLRVREPMSSLTRTPGVCFVLWVSLWKVLMSLQVSRGASQFLVQPALNPMTHTTKPHKKQQRCLRIRGSPSSPEAVPVSWKEHCCFLCGFVVCVIG